jgi:hypothetical protein
MRGAINPLPQYAFMAWCSVKKSTVTTLLGLSQKSVQFHALRNISQQADFYDELLVPQPKPNLQNHLLSAVRHCLLSIFAATIRLLLPQADDAACCNDSDLHKTPTASANCATQCQFV